MFLKVYISTLDQFLIEIEPQREIGDVPSYVDNLDKYLQPGDMHMDDQSLCFQLHYSGGSRGGSRG